MFLKKFNKKQKAKEDKKINLNENKKGEDKELSVFEKRTSKLKDIMAPEFIDFSEDETYMRLNDGYQKNLYVGVLPNSANFATFLDPLYDYGNIDTSIFISPVETEFAKQELTKAKTNLEMEFHSTKSSNRQDDMVAKVAEAKRLREEVRDGLNKIYEVSIQASLYSDDLKELNNSTLKLKQLLSQRDIGIKNSTYVQEKGYLSNKPLLKNHLGEWHMFDKRSLGCVFPFTTNNINHPNGIPIGYNMDNWQMIFYDTFYSGLDNYNMVIFAKSGGGKSTFIKSLSARSSILDDIQTVSIDIEPEYIDIAETLGGLNVKISPGTNTIINPFDVISDTVIDKNTLTQKEVVMLSSKINSVTSILLTMAKGATNSNMKFYDDILKQLIKDGVRNCYKNLGINDNPESLYTVEEERLVGNMIVGGKVKKAMPTISDWYMELKEMEKINNTDTYKPYFDYLLLVMKDYCKCENGGFTCFDGQSTVELTYEIPFINFDVSALNEKTELPLAQHIICDYIWEVLVKRNVGGHKIRIIVDEAWRMARIVNNQPVYPEALEFLDNLFRRARKKNASTVVISQQFSEFYNELTQSIIKNADTKLFLPPDSISVEEIKEVFHLTEGETEFLRNCTRGQGLLKCNTVSAKLYIDIPNFELDFVQTNQNAKRSKVNGK